MKLNKIICGDCLTEMPKIEDKSIDMILCDLPYGTTACKWDTIIHFEPLWKQYKRVIKDNGAIVLTASQPFTSKLVMSNLEMFKYEWIWEKSKATGFLNAKKSPLVAHENIIIFYKCLPTYNPQMLLGKPYNKGIEKRRKIDTYRKFEAGYELKNITGKRYPRTVKYFVTAEREGKLHPTQKPVALFEYLVKTYTNEEDLVLDNCAGSGTTGVACRNLNRNFILIEKEPKYIKIIKDRLRQKPLI